MIQFKLMIILSIIINISAYLYHNHVSLKQPYMVEFQKRCSKDIKIISKDDAYKLTSHWYHEMKDQQYDAMTQENNRQDIQYLYTFEKKDYMRMSNMMTFYYDFENDKANHMEYLIWKPRIKPVFINEPRQNSIFYPSFRQTMCLISFECIKNTIRIDSLIYSPFWNGDTNIIQKKSRAFFVDYFIEHMKHIEVSFDA